MARRLGKKRAFTRRQTQRAKKQAERLKGVQGIRNPHALSRWQVRQGHRVKG